MLPPCYTPSEWLSSEKVGKSIQVLESIVFLVTTEKEFLLLLVGQLPIDMEEVQGIFALVEDPLLASNVERVRSNCTNTEIRQIVQFYEYLTPCILLC